MGSGPAERVRPPSGGLCPRWAGLPLSRAGQGLGRLCYRVPCAIGVSLFQFYGYLSQQQNMMQDYVRTGTYQRAILQNHTDFKDKVSGHPASLLPAPHAPPLSFPACLTLAVASLSLSLLMDFVFNIFGLQKQNLLFVKTQVYITYNIDMRGHCHFLPEQPLPDFSHAYTSIYIL